MMKEQEGTSTTSRHHSVTQLVKYLVAYYPVNYHYQERKTRNFVQLEFLRTATQ